MLTLARHIRERIQIGDQIVLTVLAIGQHTVRLGIAAPPEVPIWRAELPPARRRRRAERHPDQSVGFNSTIGNKGPEEPSN